MPGHNFQYPPATSMNAINNSLLYGLHSVSTSDSLRSRLPDLPALSDSTTPLSNNGIRRDQIPQSDHSPNTSSASPTSSTSNYNPTSKSTSPQNKTMNALPTGIKKRSLNTLAARRYRQRRVDQVAGLETALKETEAERDDLKTRVARLEGELDVLRRLMGTKV